MARATRTVLLTGFEPFGGHRENASAMAVRAVDAAALPRSVELVRAELPCVFGAAVTELRRHLRAATPDLVICTGQADGSAEFHIERVAINVDDARIPDNDGAMPIDQPIADGGPVAYWSKLPVKAIVDELSAAGIAARVSQSAGTFVCNHVFYGLMRALNRRPETRGGFVHVPLVPSQVRGNQDRLPSMPVAQLARGLEIVIETSLRYRSDRRLPGGALHG